MFPSMPHHFAATRPLRWFLGAMICLCCCTFIDAMYIDHLMKMTQCTRDHRETFTSKEIRRCEKFVGKNHDSEEFGIDDQYTIFFFSEDVAPDIKEWVYNNRYCIWHLVEDVTFNDFDDAIAQINAKGMEWDADCWEPLDKTSKDAGGWW